MANSFFSAIEKHDASTDGESVLSSACVPRYLHTLVQLAGASCTVAPSPHNYADINLC